MCSILGLVGLIMSITAMWLSLDGIRMCKKNIKFYQSMIDKIEDIKKGKHD
jgi:hypothetical protein